MSCLWCQLCDDSGEFAYDGWVLAKREDADWLIFPWRNGLGGSAIRLSEEDVPWSGEMADGWAADVSIVASAHPDADLRLDDVLVELRRGAPADAQIARKVQRRRDHWEVRLGSGERRQVAIPASIDEADANRLQRAPLWCWTVDQKLPNFQFEDAEGFAAQRRSERPDPGERAVREWKDRQGRTFSPDAWVNPYNFVPLGGGPKRMRPVGHLALGDDRVSGRIQVRLTARAPLALSGSGHGTVDSPNGPPVLNGRHIVMGSHVAGVVRSFHEALTDSCLRLVDLDYVPIHRDLTSPQAIGRWRMAVVEPGGLAVRMCDSISFGGANYPAVWIERRDLASAPVDATQEYHYSLTSQDLEVPDKRFRLERVRGAVPVQCLEPSTSCGVPHWRTIVTSKLPRREAHPTGSQHPYHLPFAPLAASATPLDVQAALVHYRKASEGAIDPVTRRAGGTPDLVVSGVGQRHEVKQELTTGQTVWIEVDADGQAVRITPAVLWRHPGEGEVGKRIAGYEPCTDPDSDAGGLCPSCSVFGMVDERAPSQDERGPARVRAYRGHVRFGHGVISDVDEATHLCEMGSPRPSAGQFYLANEGFVGRQAGKDERPLREWGSSADTPIPRRVRGRKFYWANSASSRHKAPSGAHAGMSSHHCLAPVGATIIMPVWFDNLTPTQLGGLLASLDPNLLRTASVRALLPPATQTPALHAALGHELGLHMGKGKGVGLGTVVASIEPPIDVQRDATTEAEPTATVEIWDASRYTSARQAILHEAAGYVERFVAETFGSDDDEVRWAALLAMSAVDWIPNEHLRYPPDDNDPLDDRPRTAPSFDFWRKSSGAPGLVQGRPPKLVALPEAHEFNVTVGRPWLEEDA